MTKLIEFYIAFTTPVSKDERGATATEYGLLVAFIALAIIVGVTAFGNALNKFFGDIATAVGGWNV
jgi:pilus assembly protein Flp/PilA